MPHLEDRFLDAQFREVCFKVVGGETTGTVSCTVALEGDEAVSSLFEGELLCVLYSQ